MTNIVASVIITVVTNWSQVGTFEHVDGNKYKVFEGQRITNVVACIPHKGQEFRMVLERAEGSVVGEKREKIPNVVWPYNPAFYWTNVVLNTNILSSSNIPSYMLEIK